MSLRHQIADRIRRYPFLMRIPYLLYRIIQPKYTVGVIGIVFNRRREVLLVEHLFHPQLPWGIPGGWVDGDENPADAVRRELREELQLRVEVKELVMLEKTQYNHLDIAFLCETNDPIGDLSYELLRHDWVAIEQLPRLKKFHYDAIIKAQQFLKEN